MTLAAAGAPAEALDAPEPVSLWKAGLLYAALTLAATWPLILHPATCTFRQGADSDLVLWILGWDAHAFLHQPLSIFDANVYHPARNTLAFAENLIGSALIAAPVIWLTGNLVLGLNVVIIVSCALCGLGAYFLARRVGLGVLPAFLAGAVYAFAPPRFFRFAQPHLNAVQWLPFALGALHGYLDTGRRRDLRLAALFFSLQVLCSGHGAVFVLIGFVGLLAYRVALGEPIAPLRRARDLGAVGALALLPSALLFLPYRTVQREYGLVRELTPDWQTPWVNFVSSATHFHQWLISFVPGLEINERTTGSLFIGILPIALAVVALWPRTAGQAGARPRRFSKPFSREGVPLRLLAALLNLAALAALAFALAWLFIGPFKIRSGHKVVFAATSAWRPWIALILLALARAALALRVPFRPAGWIVKTGRGAARLPRRLGLASAAAWRGLPAQRRNAVPFYGLLALLSLLLAAPLPFGLWPYAYWLPGLSFIRVPGRFTILTALALAVLAGFGFQRLAAAVRPARVRALFAACCLALAVEYTLVPLDPLPYPLGIEKIDYWLNSLPKPFAIAEVPLHPLRSLIHRAAFERRHAVFMLHSTAHWQKTVHAFSGFRTPLHEELYAAMEKFPAASSLDALSRIKVNYVVVHTNYYRPGEWARTEREIAAASDRLRLLHVEGAGRVYELKN